MDPSIVRLFESIAPVEAVAGNNDGEELAARFGYRKVLELAGFRIGLVHGDGGRSTPDTAYAAFCSSDSAHDSIDAIIFGHSHIPYEEVRHGVLLFNPGSPTDKRRQSLYSFGTLELGDTIQARHYYYEDKS